MQKPQLAGARRFAPVAAALALIAGCSTTTHFSARDIQGLNPQGQAFIAAVAELCQVRPVAVMETFTRRPLFDGVVQDVARGGFAAVFIRDPQAKSPERIVLTADELLRPERLKAMGEATQRPGARCAAAFVDYQNTRRAVDGIVEARVLDLLRRMPERPEDETPPWLQPRQIENAI